MTHRVHFKRDLHFPSATACYVECSSLSGCSPKVPTLLPAALETTAQQLLIATKCSPTKLGDVDPFSGKLELVVDPRLDVASTTAFYLFGSRATSPYGVQLFGRPARSHRRDPARLGNARDGVPRRAGHRRGSDRLPGRAPGSRRITAHKVGGQLHSSRRVGRGSGLVPAPLVSLVIRGQ